MTSSFVGEVVDPDLAVWTLRVARDGHIELEYNGVLIATMTAHDGAGLLRLDEVPFERADDVVNRITSSLDPQMDEIARLCLETELAPWIAENF